MRYDYALNRIMAEAGVFRTGQTWTSAQRSLRHRLLQATKANPQKGWPWLARQEYRRNSGGYDAGELAATQDGRAITLTGGEFPDPCAGWRIVMPEASEESYIVESRTAASAVKVDRPYEGETDTGMGYRMFDPYVQLPNDVWFWEALVLEADGRTLNEISRRDTRQRWPVESPFGVGYYSSLAKPTSAAAYETGTVTVKKASAAVTGSGTAFPEWVAGHHLKIAGDEALYRILQWDSDTALTLDRAYGGYNAGAGKSFAIDPKGAMQIEVSYPREDQYTVRVEYMALPEQAVNDSDELLGDEAFLAAVLDMATADLLKMHGVDEDKMTPTMVQETMRRAQALEARGLSILSAMVGSNAPQPDEDAVVQDIRYHGGRSPRWSPLSRYSSW